MNKIIICSIILFTTFCSISKDRNMDNFILIKGGTYKMGSPLSEDWREKDEVQHNVTISNFYISKYEVTQKEYREFTGTNPSHFKGDNLPVENVTWYDAVRYCNARSLKEGLTPVYIIKGINVEWNQNADGYRLPTEAEWEYACRAGTETPFNTKKSISTDQANYYGTYPYKIESNYFSQKNLETQPGEYRQRTVSVGGFPPNKWGLYDMHGNVWEWCWDWYGEYSEKKQVDPIGASSGIYRINRGGGWNDFGKHLRCAYRAALQPDNFSFNIGFRLVRNVR